MMCDNVEDIMMLASIMMTTAIGIFRNTVGDETAKALVDGAFDVKSHI